MVRAHHYEFYSICRQKSVFKKKPSDIIELNHLKLANKILYQFFSQIYLFESKYDIPNKNSGKLELL